MKEGRAYSIDHTGLGVILGGLFYMEYRTFTDKVVMYRPVEAFDSAHKPRQYTAVESYRYDILKMEDYI